MAAGCGGFVETSTSWAVFADLGVRGQSQLAQPSKLHRRQPERRLGLTQGKGPANAMHSAVGCLPFNIKATLMTNWASDASSGLVPLWPVTFGEGEYC